MFQAFVINRLDYCNALCYGITYELMRCLQSVQNAAARLVTGTRRCDHISPVLRQLHWLPVRQRVVFKIATPIYSSTGPCPVTPRVTWPTTVSLSPTPVSDNCVLPTLKHSVSVERAAVLEIGLLPPQDHKSGTVCCPISDYVSVSCQRAVQAITEDIFIRTVRPQCSVKRL